WRQRAGRRGGRLEQLVGQQRTMAARRRDRGAAWHPVLRCLRATAGCPVGAAVPARPIAARRCSHAGVDRHAAVYLAAGRQPAACVSAGLPDRRSDRQAGRQQSAVTRPPVGATVTTLPSGTVDQNIAGKTYCTFGGAYYQPFYGGSSV